ncbi:MAG: hypothetical protein WAN35_15770 [Terracidiphilus sp.]
MLETLAGRLKWERTGTGIRVEIPARFYWSTLLGVPWLVLWWFPWRLTMIEVFIDHKGGAFLQFWLAGWTAGGCFVATFILWSLTGRSTVVLDPCQLELTRNIFVLPFSHRIFSTSDLNNLRFVPSQWKSRSYQPSKINFEAGNKTHSFASGIRESEANALIDRMQEVHEFPMESWLEETVRQSF